MGRKLNIGANFQLGYEERLCRRSNLSATLSTSMTASASHYPISLEGAVYSKDVVVFRGPHEYYKKWEEESWRAIPVISLPAVRWPKLQNTGTTYAFESEREVMRNKIRGALRLCNWEGHDHVVIGDFGLGYSHRNPPLELAKLWRDIFLYDPDIRGYFKHVAFVFEDVTQTTSKLIVDEMSKKSKSSGSGSKSKSRGHHGSGSGGGFSSNGSAYQTDFEIFDQVFQADQVRDVLARPDPRYGISMLTS